MKRGILLAAWLCVAILNPGCESFRGQEPSASAPVQQPPMTVEQRKEYLEKMKTILPNVPSWTQWQEQTGTLPPDFNSLPRINTLPDPLVFLDGKRVVKTPADWEERRAEILMLFEKYDIGRIPPKPRLGQVIVVDPAVAQAEAARAGAGGFGRGRGPATGPTTGLGRRGGRGRGRGAASQPAPGTITRYVDLKYGPDNQITTRVMLSIPPGPGPFPVFMNNGSPGITSRGYIACDIEGGLSVDRPPDIGKYYPDYDFGSMGKMAFTYQMVIDYLYTLPEVDKRYIAITGYSRIGKMAAITAMFDKRITACIAGSTGVGGILPWRSGSERGAAEGIESTTRSFPIWFAPQLRFFSGRDDRLPVDGNLIQAAIAPRSIISLYGEEDEVGNTYGNEAAYYSAQKAFDLLGVPDHNAIFHLQGHHGSNDPQATLHWLDIQFGKSNDKWTNDYLYPWDYRKWQAQNRKAADVGKSSAGDADALAGVTSAGEWEKKTPDVRKAVQRMLGTKEGGKGGPDPAQRPRGPASDTSTIVDWAIERGGSFGWLEPEKSNTEYRSFTFGQGTRAELYYPKGTEENAHLPTVVWLHGFSYPMGYMWVYRQKPDLHPILALVRAGYAVVGFDQTGHGSRTDEFATFYDRFPHWSRLGRMVADTQAVIDAVSRDGMVDPNKIYLYGYSMGGIVALHTAALDNRVKGVVSICGFTPMRTDTTDKGTGGLTRYSIDLPLLPQLGAYVGNESKLPYDYDELMATIAPRPVYVLQPMLDRDATPADVHAAVDRAKKVFGFYNATNKLVLDEPWDYNRLPQATQDRIIDWMKANMK
ncbi:MAG TPA: alpha/beta fold hydrolase [Tepidisphaeraceae bacterium]|nr:alpha/beta fold hydrolase [Tepidisphaeraceae bacterium]